LSSGSFLLISAYLSVQFSIPAKVGFDPVSGQLMKEQAEPGPNTSNSLACGHTWADQVSGELMKG
jgi:hypothetical protein